MFGKFMNNYYYGKSGKGDYQKDDLPRTRWQLFWEMLRVRFAGLFRLNIVSVIAWLPAMYVLIQLMSNLFNIAGVAQTVEMDPSAATPEQLELVQNLRPLYNSVIMRSLLLLVPAIAITGPFQAGMAYVTRNWARDEHAFVWSDFKDALIGNWKQSLVISFITGLVPLIVYVGYQFYVNNATDTSYSIDSSASSIGELYDAAIGRHWSTSDYFFKGEVDELRVSLVARERSWLTTGYNNMYSTSTFYSIGSESIASGYNSPGYLYSSIFDLGSTDKELRSMSVEQNVPSGCNLTVTVEGSDGADFSTVASEDFSDDSATYYTSSTPAALNGKRYIRYKATLTACNSNADTPALYSVKFNYR